METVFTGEEMLWKRAREGFPKGVTKIGDNVYFFLGYGGSTCTLVVGETSCLLIDCLNGMGVAKEAYAAMREITSLPIDHIIYTHYHHFDHIAGAAAFAHENTQIIGRKPTYPQYGKSAMLKDIYGVRGAKQFGIGLSEEECICLGIGPRNNQNDEKGILPCNRLFTEELLELDCNGIQVVLVAAPGETDDQLFVWLPQYQVLCCGDNFYQSWPNLYAIRGGQYRDIHGWIVALDAMRQYQPQYLLPGHTQAVLGAEVVAETLKHYRDALEYVLVETLAGMNQGDTIEQLVEKVKLPAHLASLPYLQEYYGTVAWSVRSIYTGYLGWFDGNPTKLGFLPEAQRAENMIALIGGADKVLEAIEQALAENNAQWAVELCDILLAAQQSVAQAKQYKAQGLIYLGRMQVSANGRHYYLVCANELLGKGSGPSLSGASMDAQKDR